MTEGGMSDARVVKVPCTIEIEHTADSLHAHVELEGGIEVGPGDEVIVHGNDIHVGFGERVVIRRDAIVVRATALERLRTRALAYLELTELYEVGFSAPGRK
jgi:hypothetical protein